MTTGTVYRHIANGGLKAVRAGGSLRIERAALDEWLTSEQKGREPVNLTADHLNVAFSAWAAAQDGNGVVVADDCYPAAHELAEAGWLERRFDADGELSWWWTARGDVALALSSLTDVAGREN